VRLKKINEANDAGAVIHARLSQQYVEETYTEVHAS